MRRESLGGFEYIRQLDCRSTCALLIECLLNSSPSCRMSELSEGFSSICLMRSPVTPNSLPTSSRVRLLPSSKPCLRRRILCSRGVRVSSISSSALSSSSSVLSEADALTCKPNLTVADSWNARDVDPHCGHGARSPEGGSRSPSSALPHFLQVIVPTSPPALESSSPMPSMCTKAVAACIVLFGLLGCQPAADFRGPSCCSTGPTTFGGSERLTPLIEH